MTALSGQLRTTCDWCPTRCEDCREIELQAAAELDRMTAEVVRLQAIVDRLEPPPWKCEHGVSDGDWCEPCNREYKRAEEESAAEEKARNQ
jgi:hypothetical protein